MSCITSMGYTLPDTQGTWVGGGGTNPADLGQDIRGLPSTPDRIISTTSGTAGVPANAQDCF